MTEAHEHTFPKAEKVWGKKNVDLLFAKGRWGSAGELKYCYVSEDRPEGPSPKTVRVMVSVPKRFFKRAVKRNLLKRRIREAYRLQKDLLAGKDLSLLFAYNCDRVLDFGQIYSLVGEILRTVSSKLDAAD